MRRSTLGPFWKEPSATTRSRTIGMVRAATASSVPFRTNTWAARRHTTKNDKAVGLAYAIASRLARQVALTSAVLATATAGRSERRSQDTRSICSEHTPARRRHLRVRATTSQQPAGRQLHIRALRSDRQGSGIRPSNAMVTPAARNRDTPRSLFGRTSAPQIARIRCRDQPTFRSWNGLWVRIPPVQP